jgi:hypothetical protein
VRGDSGARNAELPKALGMLESDVSLIRKLYVTLVGGPARIVVWSCIYAAYAGYRNDPYPRVVVWSAACTIAFLFWATASFARAFDAGPLKGKERAVLILAVAVQMAVTFTAVHSATYYLVRAISN